MGDEKGFLGDLKSVGDVLVAIAAIFGPLVAVWLDTIKIPTLDTMVLQKIVFTLVWFAIVSFAFVFVRLNKRGKTKNEK